MNKELKTKNYSLTIGWLYPELMSTYGDRGNVIVLQKRCEWRGIEAKINAISLGSTVRDLQKCDVIFMGGAEDRQQQIVSADFMQGKAQSLAEMIGHEVPGLYICGAYQFLGKYYKEADGTMVKGLGVLDLYTENPGNDTPRLIGNTAFAPAFLPDNTEPVVGFENHGGRTYLGNNVAPLGKVLKGFGNNGKDGFEGALYKNTLGTYLHGPILPKNPVLADWLLNKALEKKYNKEITLSSLNDELEKRAHQAIVRRLGFGV